jgi:crotonobetainyl-CoA:carnitine CoA-transferase CaiB-like acyl-CoA transferase
MADTTTRGPLADVRVIDLSTVVMGPYAAQILGDLGADVIKIESPSDTVRVGPYRTTPGMTSMNLNVNRNKRSVALNLKDPAEHEQALQLIDTADVLITNMRPGALARLGMNYCTRTSLPAIRAWSMRTPRVSAATRTGRATPPTTRPCRPPPGWSTSPTACWAHRSSCRPSSPTRSPG